MSVLVTGGAGYIGSHMVLALADAGEAVTVLDNLSTGLRTAVDSRAELVEGDIGDAELVRGIFQRKNITDVVHFAGSIVVPESVTDPLKYYSNNTAKTRNLIECCVKEAVPRFVFSSTAAVYGSPEQVPVTEDVQLAPMSPYGRSKLMSEWMLQDVAAAHELTYVVLRYFNVAGADPAGRSGQSTKDATHLIKVAVERVAGKKIDARLDARRAGDPAEIVADAALARKTLGWKPEHDDLDEIVRHAFHWERKLIQAAG